MGLGDNTIRVLVTDGDGPEPDVMATYTIYLHRENRPSLPMFGEHTMCSFLQVSPRSRPEAVLRRVSTRSGSQSGSGAWSCWSVSRCWTAAALEVGLGVSVTWQRRSCDQMKGGRFCLLSFWFVPEASEVQQEQENPC